MVNFFNKKKIIKTEEIKEFDWAIRLIKIYIALYEWSKAKKGINEISIKEKKSLDYLLEKLSNEKDLDLIDRIKNKELKNYNRKNKIIINIKNKIEKEEAIYDKRIDKERFKIRFSKIKNEIKTLVWAKKWLKAMELLKRFLEENNNNSIVLDFYNKQKKIIQKSIDKQRKEFEVKLKNNAQKEALALIWKNVSDILDNNIEENENIDEDLISKIKNRFSFFSKIKEKRKRKKLYDEINLLIEEDNKINNDIAWKKIENIHKWLVKELKNKDLKWFDIYGKILWVTKLSNNTFWLEESKEKYNFFIWEATWKGIKAWFIVTIMNKLFKENFYKPLKEIIFNINNGLKQDLKSNNFLSSIFFEINKKEKTVSLNSMWHNPIIIFRKKSKKIETLNSSGLAAWIRIIDEKENIKIQDIILEDWDLLMTYSDWIITSKNPEWEEYWIKKLEEKFKKISSIQKNIKEIYNYLINDLEEFRSGNDFENDATIIILKRDSTKDVISKDDNYIEELAKKEWLQKKDLKNIKWKTKQEIDKQMEVIKKDKEILRILKILESLYYTGETLKLKEEAIRYIKEWFIHKKINFYLKKAIENEKDYKLDQKNKKMESKYNMLKELAKKWDHETVIKEIENIIGDDWNI